MWLFFEREGRLESFWIVSDFHQNAVKWSDHDMIILSCLEIAWNYAVKECKSLQRDIDRDG
jgi:hypothetical protein